MKKTLVVQGLVQPWSMTWVKGGRSMLVTESKGSVWVLGKEAKKVEGLPRDVYQRGQGGWFDILAVGEKIYLSYSRRVEGGASTSLIRFNLRLVKGRYQAEGVERLFTLKPALRTGVHFGGRIVWRAADRSIFLSLGDRGNRSMAQERSNMVGGVVQIKIKGNRRSDKQKYFPKLYSYGHRNVQGFYYDGEHQQLWATEHGPQGGDELNLIGRGKNYGWPTISYGKEYGTDTPVSRYTHKKGMVQPILYWDPSPAFSGLWMVAGNEFPSWRGQLLLGSLKHQRLYRITLTRQSKALNRVVAEEQEQLLTGELGRIRSIKQPPRGESTRDESIYLVIDSPGRIIRLSSGD